jgi:aspartate kinase
MSYRREITTLGRGGTDTTAVALAAALGAERCEIYSDVDGVYSADPRVVEGPVHLPVIDLATLQEMAEAGAKVLNAQAVEWARRAKIAIFARKTADDIAPSGHPAKQTIAREGADVRVRAVVGLDRVVHATVDPPDIRDFAVVCGEMSLPLLDLCAGSCAIPLLNVPDWDACRAQLAASLGARVALRPGCAVVSVVGDGLHAELARFLDTLRAAGAATHAVFAGPLRLAATIDATHLVTAQRAVHAAFVDRP